MRDNAKKAVAAWVRGTTTRPGSIWTDGQRLYSYALPIGARANGKIVVYDFRGKYAVSQTTSEHVGGAMAALAFEQVEFAEPTAAQRTMACTLRASGRGER